MAEVLDYASKTKTSLTRIMLDNMVVPLSDGDIDVSMLKEAVELINGKFETEVQYLLYVPDLRSFISFLKLSTTLTYDVYLSLITFFVNVHDRVFEAFAAQILLTGTFSFGYICICQLVACECCLFIGIFILIDLNLRFCITSIEAKIVRMANMETSIL